jgi:DNA-binding transcriptional ArsR family regulator
LTSSLAVWLNSYIAEDIDSTVTTAVFRALADPTRRQILYQLRKGELSAGEIASHFPISGPSVSRHLAVLRSAGLVAERRQANKVIYSLVPGRLAVSLGSFLSAVCPDRLDRGRLDRGRRGKKKNRPADKASAKRKRKTPSGGRRSARPEGLTDGASSARMGDQDGSTRNEGAPESVSATE